MTLLLDGGISSCLYIFKQHISLDSQLFNSHIQLLNSYIQQFYPCYLILNLKENRFLW